MESRPEYIPATTETRTSDKRSADSKNIASSILRLGYKMVIVLVAIQIIVVVLFCVDIIIRVMF